MSKLFATRSLPAALILSGFISLWPVGVLQAQTLQEAVRKSLGDYPAIKAQQAVVDGARAEVDRAGGARLPVLSASYTHNRINDLPNRDLATPLLNWRTPIDGRAQADMRRAQHALDAAAAKLELTRNDVSLQVTEAWLGVVRGQQTVALARQNLAEHESILGDVARIAAADPGRAIDLDQAQVRVDGARLLLTQREAELRQAQERLSRFGAPLPPASSFQTYPALSRPVPASPAQALQTLDGQPALAQAQSQLEEARARVDGARRLHNPTLDLQLAREYHGPAFGNQATGRAIFTVPIFQGGMVEAGVRSAVAQAQSAQDARAEVELLVRERVNLAYTDRAAAQQRLDLSTGQRDRSLKLVEGYRQQFRVARRSLLDLLNIQNEYASYQQAAAIAQHDLRLAEARISAALGQLAASFDPR